MPATDTYKVSVGYQDGYFGEGEISYGGPNCRERAKLAGEVVKRRLEQLQVPVDDLRLDLIGLNSISPLKANFTGEPPEVRLRVAGRTQTKSDAQKIANEVEALYTNGPEGGGGATKQVSEVIAVASIFVPKSDISTQVLYQEIR